MLACVQHEHQRQFSLEHPHRASTPLRPPTLASKASSKLLSLEPITVHTCYRGHIRIRYLSCRQPHPQDVEGQSHAAVSASRQDLSSSPIPENLVPTHKRGYAGTTWNGEGYSSTPQRLERLDGLISSSAMDHTMVRSIPAGQYPNTPTWRVNT